MLTCPYPYRVFYVVNENLTVADIAGPQPFYDLVAQLFDSSVFYNRFYFYLRKKIDVVIDPPVDLLFALLRPSAGNHCNCHTAYLHVVQHFFNVFQLFGPDQKLEFLQFVSLLIFLKFIYKKGA
jgi:hypothetical protein